MKLSDAQQRSILAMGDMGTDKLFSAVRVGVWMALPPVNGRTLAVLERVGAVVRNGDGMWRLTADGMAAYDALKAPAHQADAEAMTLDSGDTVYVGRCEHGWTTGFHTTEQDAVDVALGHGKVSRPLYGTIEVTHLETGTEYRMVPACGAEGPTRLVVSQVTCAACLTTPEAIDAADDWAAFGAVSRAVAAEEIRAPFRAVKGKLKVSARRSRNRW